MASIFMRTVIIYLFLSLALKLMGKRQIGELEVSELVSALLISEVASIPMQDPDLPLFGALIPILFILSAEVLISALKNRSSRLKRLVEGTPVFLIRGGKIDQSALEKNRISINELLAELRVAGYFDPSEVEYCILEANGKLSVCPTADGSPLTRSLLSEPAAGMAHPLIFDGEINRTELKKLGLDENWLTKKLDGTRLSEVFLLTADDVGKINIYMKEKEK